MSVYEHLQQRRKRKERMTKLAEMLGEMHEQEFPAAYEKNADLTELLKKIRSKERLITTELSILRLLQGEDRMINNLITPLVSLIGVIVGAIIGKML